MIKYILSILVLIIFNCNILFSQSSWELNDNVYYNKNRLSINNLFFANDINSFYTFSMDYKIRKWDVATGNIIDSLNIPKFNNADYKIFYIDSSLILIGYKRDLLGFTFDLYNYRDSSLIYKIYISDSNYTDLHSNDWYTKGIYNIDATYDNKNLNLLLNITLVDYHIKNSFEYKYLSEIWNIKESKLVKRIGLNHIYYSLVDTIDNCYNYNFKDFIKVDNFGNKILDFEKPYGKYIGINYPCISSDRKYISGIASNGPKLDYFIWDYYTGKLIDSIEHTNFEEFLFDGYHFYNGCYSTFSWDNTKIIFSSAMDIKPTTSRLKIWDIKKRKITFFTDFKDMFISNPIKIINSNAVLFASSNQYLWKLDYDEFLNINENTISQNLNYFSPNPSSDYIYLNDEIKFKANIQIINSLGIKEYESEFKDKIDISQLNSGFYILKINDIHLKLIKL